MPLSPSDRIIISKRLINLPNEIAISTSALTNLGDTKNDYTALDAANRNMLDESVSTNATPITEAYLLERMYLTGQFFSAATNSFTMVETDTPLVGPKFFPSGLSSTNIAPEVNLYTGDYPSPAATEDDYESWVIDAFTKCVGLLHDGLLPLGEPSTTLAADYNTGVDSHLCRVTTAEHISNNSLLILHEAPATDHLVYVISGGGTVGPTNLNVRSIGGAPIIASGEQVVISLAAPWDNAARAGFPVVTPYMPIAAAVDAFMMGARLNDLLANEHAALHDNKDPIYASQVAAALAATDTAPGSFNAAHAAWKIAANKYQDVTLLPFGVVVGTRSTGVATRLSQLSTALGAVLPIPVSGYVLTRYTILDARVNRSHGSIARTSGSTSTESYVQAQKATSEGMQSAYSALMLAVNVIEEPDDTNTIYVDAVRRTKVGLTPGTFNDGDVVYVMADGQSELAGTIEHIYGDGRVDLTFIVPSTYTTENNLRFYKEI